MAEAEPRRKELKNTGYEIFIGALSVLSILNIVLLYAVASEGRLFAALIIIIGVGIFGTFTGYLANVFLSPKHAKAQEPDGDLRVKFTQIQALMAEQQIAMDELALLLSAEDGT